jgi:hypothetical protein
VARCTDFLIMYLYLSLPDIIYLREIIAAAYKINTMATVIFIKLSSITGFLLRKICNACLSVFYSLFQIC